jgi:hypothetical protein
MPILLFPRWFIKQCFWVCFPLNLYRSKASYHCHLLYVQEFSLWLYISGIHFMELPHKAATCIVQQGSKVQKGFPLYQWKYTRVTLINPYWLCVYYYTTCTGPRSVFLYNKTVTPELNSGHQSRRNSNFKIPYSQMMMYYINCTEMMKLFYVLYYKSLI